MNTSSIKTFAREARNSLRESVEKRLKFWNIDAKGKAGEGPEKVTGGYIYQGQIYNDGSIPAKWKKLVNRIHNAQDRDDTIEEAAYTWFNRLMVLRILEKNNYIAPILQWATGTRTPKILQDAKLGKHRLQSSADSELLRLHLHENKEEQALSILIMEVFTNHPILVNLFGPVKSELELLLPDDLLHPRGFFSLLMETDAITDDDYQEVELIGWLYQFYISDKKDEVFAGFKKNKKARAQDIPAATQIFTPKWIVKYMVENTVGKIYLDYETDSSLREGMKYLVETDDRDNLQSRDVTLSGVEGTSRESRKSIISDITDLTLIDPACGSGHILVTGFDLLFKMYREQGYTAKQAVESIIEHNLFGLDIDDRAMQLARFAVLLKAAQYYPDILNPNPSALIPKIYSFPEASPFTSEELQNFLGDNGHQSTAELKEALQLLNQGKNIGSALKLELSEEARSHIKGKYQTWSQKSKTAGLDIEQSSIWNRLQTFLDVLLVLTNQYTAVVANPPYMGQKSMNGELKDYVNSHYPMTKSDLMTIFMEVIPNMTSGDSRFALINLPSWLFLSSFEKIREHYIDHFTFDSLLHMGRGIFGIDFGSVAFAMKKTTKKDAIGTYFRLHERNFQHIYYEDIKKLFLYSNNNEDYKYDFTQYRGEEGITEIPKEGTTKGLKLFYPNIPQTNFSKIPGSPIAYWVSEKVVDLYEHSLKAKDCFDKIIKGIFTGNNEKFLKYWFEVSTKSIGWHKYNKAGGLRKWYGLATHVLDWRSNGAELKSSSGAGLGAMKHYNRPHLVWSGLGSGDPSFRWDVEENWFDDVSPAIVDEAVQMWHVGYLNSSVAKYFLKLTNPTLHYQTGDVKKVPFIKIDNVGNLESLSELAIEISKNDWNSRETSWDFEKNPLIVSRSVGIGISNDSDPSCNPKALNEAYESCQEKVTQAFFQLHTNEEELNRIFIDIYGLQDELTPEVALKDITILQEELDRNQLEQDEVVLREEGLGISRLDKGLPLVPENYSLPINKSEVLSQFLSYAMGIFLGRYRLDKPGLNIAHPDPSAQEMAAYIYNGHKIEIDEDGIVPLLGEDGAFPDDALRRTKDLILAIWGEDTLTENINFLQEGLGMDLHKWFTEKFWPYHTSMYKKKPIYWLFSSNPAKPQKAAFRVIVYIHRMDRFTLQKIRNQYLHPHQDYQAGQLQSLRENEANLTSRELKQLDLLQQQIIECRQYDDRLKILANEQITFDLDDGVTENYKLFEGVVAEIK